jgi:hypothetical protein
LLTNQILPNWHDESKPRNTGILDAAPPDRHPLPADNADLVSAVMRAQLTGLKAPSLFRVENGLAEGLKMSSVEG